jgi:hypothetical protein
MTDQGTMIFGYTRISGEEQNKNLQRVVVWKLDRLSRSLKDLLIIMEHIDKAGSGFRSLTESIDTTTPAGRMMMQMIGAFAEFEREMIRESVPELDFKLRAIWVALADDLQSLLISNARILQTMYFRAENQELIWRGYTMFRKPLFQELLGK